MVFSSTIFIFCFLPFVMGIYYLPVVRRSKHFKNYFLLLTSLLFYAWGEPIYVFLMMTSILVSYFIGLEIEHSAHKKVVLTIGVIYHISVLFVFKYLSFLSSEFLLWTGIEGKAIEIALPIGISFFTFQMMSYLFDVYYGNAIAQRNLLNLALYVSLFPQLVAGPIVRYETVAEEIDNRMETREDFENGIRRFAIGLGKKALLADYLAIIADTAFSNSSTDGASALCAWGGAIAYTLEIYFDFSGYSDMAIGLGQCFGFHFKENFNRPYLADSIGDFWKRWHISLTDWFRDYVYTPLLYSSLKRSHNRKPSIIPKIIIIWILTGIWHGANWTFLLFGLIFCFFQIAEKYIYNIKKWPILLRHIYTLLIVCFCQVIFRADSVTAAMKYIADMFGRTSFVDAYSIEFLKNSIITILIGIAFCLPWGDWIRKLKLTDHAHAIGMSLEYIALGLVVIVAASKSISGGYSPFIYFNF